MRSVSFSKSVTETIDNTTNLNGTYELKYYAYGTSLDSVTGSFGATYKIGSTDTSRGLSGSKLTCYNSGYTHYVYFGNDWRSNVFWKGYSNYIATLRIYSYDSSKHEKLRSWLKQMTQTTPFPKTTYKYNYIYLPDALYIKNKNPSGYTISTSTNFEDTYTYTCSDNSVLSITNNKIDFVGKGNANIIVTNSAEETKQVSIKTLEGKYHNYIDLSSYLSSGSNNITIRTKSKGNNYIDKSISIYKSGGGYIDEPEPKPYYND